MTLKKLGSVVHPTLENGVRHQDVVQLKKDLAKAGFKVPGKGTTLFGKQTEVQVKSFQKYYGLSQSGKVDNKTNKKMKDVVHSPLQKGKRDSATVQLKKDLAIVGFEVSGNNTTLFGTKTEEQVKAFQKENGLVQNGIADEVTLAKLQEVVKEASEKNEENEANFTGVKEEIVTKPITFETIKEEDETLEKGKTKVKQVGKDGELKTVYEVTYKNGKEVSRKEISANTTNPVKEVILVGTKVTTKEEEVVTEYIDFETVTEKDPSLVKGETKTKQAGAKGEVEITYEITYVNGEKKSQKEIKRETVKEPLNEIIAEGTKLALATPYISEDNGMTVTMKKIEVIKHEGFDEYKISYEEKNNTSDKVIDQGAFKIFYTNGESEPQYGGFNKLYPGERAERTYVFKALKNQELQVLEYGADLFFNTTPSENTLKWTLN